MGETEIPGVGFEFGCAIAVKSGDEILLIGGQNTEQRILSFNVKDHIFRELQCRLNEKRYGHSCAFIPKTTLVMITGGRYNFTDSSYLDSTEILDIKDESVKMANPLNSKRCYHGMGILTINGEDRLATFGGKNSLLSCMNTVEIYNTQTEEWEPTDIRLKGT